MFERTRPSTTPRANVVTAKRKQVADTLRSAKKKVQKQGSAIKKAASRTSSRYGRIGRKMGEIGDGYQAILEEKLSDDDKAAVATFLAPDALNSLESDSEDNFEI